MKKHPKHRSAEEGQAAAPPAPAATAGDGQGAVGAQPELMREVAARQAEVVQALNEMSGQNAFVRQQVSQLYGAVSQLYQAVSAQCQQLLQSDTAIQQEIQKLQTGGPQRAMAGVYQKLFRDLIQHVNELDEMIAGGDALTDPAVRPWVEALRVARERFEATLKDWGCSPLSVGVGEQEFDPEQHEAVEARPGEVPPAAPLHTVVLVRRRGWVMNGQVLQYPQVVVS